MDIEHQDDGWEGVALRFAAIRSDTGHDVIRRWADSLPSGGEVLDIGCGSGFPIASSLVDKGLTVFGIDASPTLVSMFRQRFSRAQVACETAQNSPFFNRTFDGVVAIGLMFLLSENAQGKLINKVAGALRPGGRFLFSAPRQKCEWKDMLTGQQSVSLGEAEYALLLAGASMQLTGTYMDEGGNHYFEAAPWSTRTERD